MSGVVKLGSIPSFSVWQDETLNFRITSKLGFSAQFSRRTIPQPKGHMSLGRDGFFEFTPAAADRDDISITITAALDGRTDEQTFVITPRPRLAPEFKYIRHLTDLPERSDVIYNTYAEEDAGKVIFNNTTDFLDKDADKAKIDTKNVSISGIQIILEANHASGYFDILDDRTNVQRLTICADEVIIRSPLRMPGTDVYIYARVLYFEGGSDGGSINTTPRAVTIRSQDRDEGLKGQRAGGVHLYVSRIDEAQRGLRIIANGADGQPARLGLPPKPATDLAKWDGKGLTTTWGSGHEELNWSNDFHTLGGYEPIYAQIWQYYPAQVIKPWQYQFEKGDNQNWPSDGNPPDKYPGRPGQGGDSGAISVGKFEWIDGRYMRRPGVPGAKAEDIKACPAGKPQKACKIRADYQAYMIPSTDRMVDGDGIANRKRGVHILDGTDGKPLKRETKDGPPGPALPANPATPFGREGAMNILADQKSWFWLHKSSVRALIPYIHDAMLAGHAQTSEVRDLLVTYVVNTAVAAQSTSANRNDPQKISWSSLNSELAGLLQRMDSPYDFYGNPAGWVPMLSFQTNLTLFDNETEDALRILFLVYWLEKTANRKQKATKTLTAAIESLRKETAQAEKDYEAASAKIGGLETECANIDHDMRMLGAEIFEFERDLKRLVAEDLRREHVLRGGAKILGGIMQLVPVGQPVLGAFGKAGVALADIDFEKPMSVAPGVVKAFAPLVQKKVSEKVKALMEKAKEGKTSVKKETDKEKEFKEAVAEAELEEKVEKHLEEQKEIKNGIIEAFSGIAVKDSEIEERLEQLIADCPELKTKTEKLKELNSQKAEFVEQLLSALQTIDESIAVMLSNQLAIIKMRGQRDELILNLSNGVLQYAQAMGERARQRLLKYQYYLMKSYQYLILKDTSGLDFRALKLFNQFAATLTESENGTLTDTQLKTLKTVFRDQVKEDILKVIDLYQGNAPSLGGSFDVSLTEAELKTLNTSDDNRLDLDLMQRGGLDLHQDNMRITKVQATTVEVANPEAGVTVNLEFFHDGFSRLRKFGQQFLFRAGDYSVAPSGGAGNERGSGQMAHRLWGANVKYDGKTQKIEDMIPDPAAGSLLRYLIGDENRSKEGSLYFRPAAWSGLQIRLSTVPIGAKGALKKLTLTVHYVSDATPDSLSTVLVRQFDDANLVRCSAEDLNGCSDGQGTFLRTFAKNATPKVTFRVPAQKAERNFIHWRRIAGQNEDFVTQTSIELDLKKTSAYTLEPIYAKEKSKPDSPTAWPKCTTGWESMDWIVANRTKDTFKVKEVDAFPYTAPMAVPVPETPHGSNIARFSIQQVEIPPGGQVRLSICINPQDPHYPGYPAQLRSFWERSDGQGYTIYFNGKGGVHARLKDAEQRKAEDEITVDEANHTLTFK